MIYKSSDWFLYIVISLLVLCGCSGKNGSTSGFLAVSGQREVYIDKPYKQEYAVKYYLSPPQQGLKLRALSCDRDGHVRILAGSEVLVPDNGSLFYPGKLIRDIAYSPTAARKIMAVATYRDQTVYLDSEYVFSNAWAGSLQLRHRMKSSSLVAGGRDFDFVVCDSKTVTHLDKDEKVIWSANLAKVQQIVYLDKQESFLIVLSDRIYELTQDHKLKELFRGENIRCACSSADGKEIAVGTGAGYLLLSDGKMRTKLPCTDITSASEINGQLWFGSSAGAFRLNPDGKFSYFAGERWLPGNQVIAISEGPDNSVLVLTDKGLGKICSRMMTLEEKAAFYEKQVREKNIRYGFNCSSSRLEESYSSGKMAPQPSDNLWTSMYLAAELFRYKVTGSQEARQNAYESFKAMERLFTVTNIEGLFARSIERDYKIVNARMEGWEQRELLSGSPAELWLPTHDHPNWTWRSTASSDQTVGQIFALTMVLEFADDSLWKNRALNLLDGLMGYIVKNDLYIIDVDGKPTLWGKWNPDYVNKFPENVGDRRLNSSNIIAFLQTAYHFTGKAIYKEKAMELLDKFGYLSNLTRPMKLIGNSDHDNLSDVLSAEWNHSDDEMYFLAYWGLFPFALTPDLREKYAEAIKDHWEMERSEKNALWNFTYAMTGADRFDLGESAWFLKNYPLDMRNWGMSNSGRKDITLLGKNFRGQTTQELLPLGELPLYRHNGQIFTLDSSGDGKSLISAGDVWLLPYWMGRYLGVISAPQCENSSAPHRLSPDEFR